MCYSSHIFIIHSIIQRFYNHVDLNSFFTESFPCFFQRNLNAELLNISEMPNRTRDDTMFNVSAMPSHYVCMLGYHSLSHCSHPSFVVTLLPSLIRCHIAPIPHSLSHCSHPHVLPCYTVNNYKTYFFHILYG